MVVGCSKCLAFLNRNAESIDGNLPDGQGCPICLGSFSPGGLLMDKLRTAIDIAILPYGGSGHTNRFSLTATPPTVHLPGDIVYRYAVAAAAAAAAAGDNVEPPPYVYAQDVKNHVRETLVRFCAERNDDQETPSTTMDDYPECVRDEELGYLALYVVLLPSPGHVVARPPDRLFPKCPKSSTKSRQFVSQGGDPAATFETRLRREGHVLWSLKEATLAMEDLSNIDGASKDLFQKPLTNTPFGMNVHVVVWRRPFYLRGLYTKARRDVSQTPFHAAGGSGGGGDHQGGKRRRIGVTSVEEQITPAIVAACHGISDRNNNPELAHNLIFGMAKFHASGREDLDVRMMLPPVPPPDDATTSVVQRREGEITGRPFVYEIFDANRLPPVSALQQIVDEVNHETTEADAILPHRTYGKNPMGVGIAPDLTFVPSSAFSGLQNETESKTKYYGCLCWSHDRLPETDAAMAAMLGQFPLTIRQRTPIRVLHRRSNMVRERQVLTCQAQRVDDHYFRLHLSTSAGTYVKEFVHGDLGRTVPSIASLLGCTTDILELDCEGIMM